MSRGTAHLRVLEEDHGVDAVTFEKVDEGITYLFVRPKQSFEYAVKGILRVCPELDRSEAQELVRVHCHTIVEMNERLGADQNIPRFEAAPDAGAVAPPPALTKETGTHRRPRAPRWAKIAAVAAPALVGGALLAQVLQPTATSHSANGTTAGAPSISQDDKVAAGTYRNPDFEKIAKGGQMKCDPMGPYEAKCVDADGKVMSSEASVGTSTAFTFSYDYEKIGFRVFPDPEGASAWAAEDANKDLYQNVRQHGRIVLWGTDAKRLKEWEQSIGDEQGGNGGHATPTAFWKPMAFAAPLPDRLATLAFGTLGVTEEVVQAAVQRDDAESIQLLRAVQLVLGSADGAQLDYVPSGAGDAVAVVADATSRPQAERNVPDAEPTPDPVVTKPPVEVTPAVDPAPNEQTVPTGGTGTGTGVGEATDTATESKPPTPTAPDPATTQPPKPPVPPVPPVKDETPPPVVEEPDTPDQDDAPEPPTAEQPAEEEPEAPPVEEPPAPPVADGPEMTPAPPVTEEPEDDGLALGELPAAWAA